MNREEAQNIVIAFESLSKEDKEQVLKIYFKFLLAHAHGHGIELHKKCCFSLQLLRTSMQHNQTQRDEQPIS